MSGVRTRAATACAVALALSLAGPAAAAQVGGAGLGLNSTVVEVEEVVRDDTGLRIVLTLTNPTDEVFNVSRETPVGGPPGFSGVGVLDPATGRTSTAVRSSSCPCSTLPPYLNPHTAATFTVELPDPGGDVVDVLFAGYAPVSGVEVEGDPDADAADEPAGTGVSELRPRALRPVPRTKQGAVSRTGKAVALDTDVLFAFGSARLTAAAGADLDRAATVLRAQDARRVSVEGHTDSTGAPGFNQRLSEQRAQTVRDALATRLGAGWTLTVRGFGETRPVAPEVTDKGEPYPEGQARNRRVELRVAGR